MENAKRNSEFLQEQITNLQSVLKQLQERFFNEANAKDPKAQETIKLMKVTMETYLCMHQQYEAEKYIMSEAKPLYSNSMDGFGIGRFYEDGTEVRVGDLVETKTVYYIGMLFEVYYCPKTLSIKFKIHSMRGKPCEEAKTPYGQVITELDINEFTAGNKITMKYRSHKK